MFFWGHGVDLRLRAVDFRDVCKLGDSSASLSVCLSVTTHVFRLIA